MPERIVFHQKLLEKAYFIFKMTGPAMVRPANSDLLKALLVTFDICNFKKGYTTLANEKKGKKIVLFHDEKTKRWVKWNHGNLALTLTEQEIARKQSETYN